MEVRLVPDVMARGAAARTGAPEGLEVRLCHLALVLVLQRVLHHGVVAARKQDKTALDTVQTRRLSEVLG